MPAEEFIKQSIIQNETSRFNSILYSCFNNDPTAIDQTFSKFVTWIRNLVKTKNKHDDLELLIGPLFCHMFLEVLFRGHTEQATNFFRNHLPFVDSNRCDNLIKGLINDFANNIIDTFNAKEFRTNKYLVRLKPHSITMLKEYLAESGHVILLQVIQNWFALEDNIEQEDIDEDAPSSEEEILCNGHEQTCKQTESSIQKLVNVIEALKADPPPIYSVNIANIKDDITCGKLNRREGLFAYSYNNSIILRSLQTLKQLENTVIYGEMVLLGHSSRIYDIAFFNESPYLVSASQDNTLRLFDLNNYTEKMVYKGHHYPIYCVAPSSNGAYIASGSYDYSARLWSVMHKETLRVFAGHTQEVTSINFHSNCTYVVTGSADKHVRMWSVKDAQPVRLLVGSKGTVYTVSFTPNGKYVVSAGEDKRLRIWDLTSAKQLMELKTGPCPVIKIAISDDQSVIATGTVDGVVRTWNFASLLKNSENPVIEPIHDIQLDLKLLSLDHCFGTFGCLTSEHSTSSLVM